MQHRPVVVVLASAALVAATAVPSQAARPPRVEVVNQDVLAPFGLALQGRQLLVADGFTTTVSRLTDAGLEPVASPEGVEDVAGLAVSADRKTIAYTTTTFSAQASTLETLDRKGNAGSVDLGVVEFGSNPDADVAYGVDDPAPCVVEGLEALEAPVSYTGIADSHPYAVEAKPEGGWWVADAGGNTILSVNRRGKASALAVLPAQPYTFTAESAAALGLDPECFAGVTYAFEAVPTDVERGPHGWLYISTLPGGPESPALGARGAVWKLNPRTGELRQVASGFLGATNLAVADDGTVYVTELFGGRIAAVDRKGNVTTAVEIDSPLSVEIAPRGLWVGTLAPLGEQGPEGPGTIVRVTW